IAKRQAIIDDLEVGLGIVPEAHDVALQVSLEEPKYDHVVVVVKSNRLEPQPLLIGSVSVNSQVEDLPAAWSRSIQLRLELRGHCLVVGQSLPEGEGVPDAEHPAHTRRAMRRVFACPTETGRIGRQGGRPEIRFRLPADQGGELVDVPSRRCPFPWGRMAGAPAPLSLEAVGKGNDREEAQ